MIKKNLNIKNLILFLLFLNLIYFFNGCGSSSKSSSAKWTFMVYMDGDNNLDTAAIADLEEMKAVGSNSKVNIVVQCDTLNSFTGTRRYYIKKNEAQIIEQLEEQDMSDPSVLTAFINWATEHYPAEHYILVLWNHGDAWRKTKGLPLFKGLLSDDTSGGSTMTIPALSGAISACGKKLDIIAMDACLMANLEVAYQIKNLGSYMVGSEETEPANGWPYTPILTALTNNPNMTSIQLCQQIVNDYITNTSSSNITMSAIDLSKINDLADKVNQFGEALLNSSETTKIANAKNNAQRYTNEELADLYHFANLISTTTSNKDDNIIAKASAVKSALENAVIANNKSGTGVANSYGLTVYLPQTYDSTYENTIAFAQEKSHWTNFIKHNNPPVISWVRQNPNPLTINTTGKIEAYITDADGSLDIEQVLIYQKNNPSNFAYMYDDGLGQDSIARDNIYTVGIRISSGETRNPKFGQNLLEIPENKTTAILQMVVKAKDRSGNEDTENFNLNYSY